MRKTLFLALSLFCCFVSQACAFAPSSGQPYYIYNPTKNKLPIWRAALSSVKAGTADTRVIFLGTSTVAGYCSTAGSWALGHTAEYLFAQALTDRYGVSANTQSTFGNSSADGTSRITADSRISLSGFAPGVTYSLGGPQFIGYSGQYITFTPKDSAGSNVSVDTFKIWHGKESTSGSCKWSLDGGSTTTFSNTATTTDVGVETITTTLASHTLKIEYASGDRCQIIGIEAYNSANKYVSVVNSGVGGVVAANWDWSGPAKAFGFPQVMGVIKPSLLIIWMNNNDAIANTDNTAYKATMQKYITQVKTTNSPAGDVVLVSQIPYGAGAGTISNNTTKLQALKDLADTNGIMWINLASKYPTYVSLTSAGLSCGDDLHMNASGYDLITKLLVDALGGPQ